MIKRLFSAKYRIDGQRLILLLLLMVISLGQVNWSFTLESASSTEAVSVSADEPYPCSSSKTFETSPVTEERCETDSLVCFSCTGLVSENHFEFTNNGKEVSPSGITQQFQSKTPSLLLRPPIKIFA